VWREHLGWHSAGSTGVRPHAQASTVAKKNFLWILLGATGNSEKSELSIQMEKVTKESVFGIQMLHLHAL